jgi:hypothetical protein
MHGDMVTVKIYIMKKRLIIVTSSFVFVFAIILNKIVNERNVQRLGLTFSEIYDDRLLVESYIYQLTDLFYKKKIVLLKNEGMNYSAFSRGEMQKQTSEIIDVTQKYALTRFAENEKQVFEELKENIGRLKDAEANLLVGGNRDSSELERICELSVGQLKLLSSIQVSEGNLLKENARKVLSSSHLAVQLEWAVLLFIAISLVSILRKRKIFEKIFPKYQLN